LPKKQQQQTFEAALQRLEEIVNMLESGEIPLDESIKIFEEGGLLVKFCLAQLEDAEKKVQKLVKNDDGSFQLELL
jgi:exodeoxyribonuclease VII small subunit